MRFFLIISSLFFSCFATAQSKFLLPDILEEASGIVYANADSIWWHNDSGDTPTLYLTDKEGTLKQQVNLPVKHVDWEDLSYDDKGNIYIGDVGNNKNARKNLKIYIYHPTTEKLDSILYSYPDQQLFPPPRAARNFDMEGFFWHQNKLHLFSKNKLGAGNYYTKHYTLPARAGEHVATFRDSIYLKNRVVTSAAISPDKKTIALLAYDYNKVLGFLPKSATSIYVIDKFKGTNFLKGRIQEQGLSGLVIASQYESLDFVDNNRVIVASEKTKYYKQKARVLSLKGKKEIPRKRVIAKQ